MKNFVATISYKGSYFGGSQFKKIAASSKAVALRRAQKYANEVYSTFDDVVVSVEELTAEKTAAIDTALNELEKQYQILLELHVVNHFSDEISI